jgi:ribosome-binding ATPase
MGFNCGIVGLPNVGKSTLFNALTATQAAQAANYPFCTIEPNVGRVAVPDPRLDALAGIASSAKIIATQLEFVDIAGLVKGASKGEGLGNQFLGNIREVDAIAHVLRCFEDGDVTHVSGKVDPVSDAEIVETELMLADLDSLEKRLPALEKRALFGGKGGGDKEAAAEAPVVRKALDALREGKAAREAAITAEERPVFARLQLITAKPMMYVLNVEESAAATGNAHSKAAEAFARSRGMPSVVISAAIEAEVAQLPPEDQAEYLSSLGLKETGLARVVHAGYGLLDLVTFFTVGPKEARAWTVRREARAPEAAGVIHTDFEKGFIRAETIAYDDYVSLKGESGARDAGKLRLEGKEYAVQDGDVFHFRFNV